MEYAADPLLLIMAGLVLSFLVLLGLWLRQSRVLRQLEEQEERLTYRSERLEELLRNQERILLREGSREGEASRAEIHRLQQRLLVQISRLYQALERRFGEMQKVFVEDAGDLRADLLERFDGLRRTLSQNLAESRLDQQQGLARGVEDIGNRLAQGLGRNAEDLGRRMDGLTESTDRRLKEISGQVERRLSEGFEKTTETFTRVLEHLSRIDEAQKRITELSSNVVSLQEVLADKRSRGAFGEVQLNALVRNLIPDHGFSLQHTLSNGARVDCILFLPEPTGSISIDAKFPLESYRRMTDNGLVAPDRARAAGQFRRDIRRHIVEIADKYIVPGETSDGAMMFIPAESVFSEIHAHHPELVEEAFQRRVWMVSPTTVMAILTTARAVLKDAATRQQVHVIQRYLHLLSKDFLRFQERMEQLSRHIRQAHRDVDEVNVSARRISTRFGQIEQVDLSAMQELDALDPPAPGGAGPPCPDPGSRGRFRPASAGREEAGRGS